MRLPGLIPKFFQLVSTISIHPPPAFADKAIDSRHDPTDAPQPRAVLPEPRPDRTDRADAGHGHPPHHRRSLRGDRGGRGRRRACDRIQAARGQGAISGQPRYASRTHPRAGGRSVDSTGADAGGIQADEAGLGKRRRLLLAAGGIVGGFVYEGGQPFKDMVGPSAALIVFGGCLGATLLSHPPSAIRLAASRLKDLFYEEDHQLSSTIDDIVAYCRTGAQERSSSRSTPNCRRSPIPTCAALTSLSMAPTSRRSET
ncbi:MAG: hypothetical protein MZV70_19240 [Desulfobacterales bacterium]|nr:hypothetical protein [Desulfobacterales bacterium]